MFAFNQKMMNRQLFPSSNVTVHYWQQADIFQKSPNFPTFHHTTIFATIRNEIPCKAGKTPLFSPKKPKWWAHMFLKLSITGLNVKTMSLCSSCRFHGLWWYVNDD